MSNLRAGALRHRMALQAAQRVGDGGGGAIETWSDVAEVWARIAPVGGNERVLAEAITGQVTHEITIRHRSDVRPAMRFRFGARIFEIVTARDVDERRRMLRCLCREDML